MIGGFLAGLLGSFFAEHLNGVIRRMSVAIIRTSVARFPPAVADRWRGELLCDLAAEEEDGALFGLTFAVRVARQASALERELRPQPTSLREAVEIAIAPEAALVRRVHTRRSRLVKPCLIAGFAFQISMWFIPPVGLGRGFEPSGGWDRVPWLRDRDILIPLVDVLGSVIYVGGLLTLAALAVWGALDVASGRGWRRKPALVSAAVAGATILAPSTLLPPLLVMGLSMGLCMYGALAAAPVLLTAFVRVLAAGGGAIDRCMPTVARLLLNSSR